MKYKTAGVCAQEINFEIENVNGENIVKSVQFVGGCNGNASGISKLVEGMKVSDVIAKLEGVHCGFKKTSCPDQLSLALKQVK
jgi:uncharacterized protein (TIGR03905 family)